MSNIFQDVLKDATGVEQNLLGPDYPYWKNIKNPQALGMSSNGSLSTMAKDIDGLIQYVQVLVTGGGASTTGGPLGNKFFLQTGGKCTDVNTKQEVDRYIYVNNIPMGNVPFISSGLDTNFSDFKGLIPGTMSNLNVLNPYAILGAFTSGSTPQCQEITMQTIGPTPPPTSLPTNAQGTETHYVSLVDIGNMDACSFSDGKNPVTGRNCKESFETMLEDRSEEKYYAPVLIYDPIAYLYFFSLGAVAIYIVFCLTCRKRS
jgi:hypothetical protein